MGNQLSTRITLQELDAIRSTMKRGPEKNGSSKNEKLVAEKVIQAFNLRDMKTIERITSPDAYFFFKGAEQGMPMSIFLESVATMHASFPDICLSYDEIVETRPGVVKVVKVRSRGTHTGAPFAYGPFPPISKTGIVVEDQSEFIFHIQNGKIAKLVFAMEEGDLIGPAGYYVKIGGKIHLQ